MGFAAPADEELADTISVGDYLIRDKDASYLLKVEGDSLNNAGILDGDFVIFERSGNYKKGDLVVVLTSDGYQVTYLKATNGPTQVVGVVTGSFRTYF